MAEASLTVVELEEGDVPGALLDEALEAHNMAALRTWLTCHGVVVATSLKKGALINK